MTKPRPLHALAAGLVAGLILLIGYLVLGIESVSNWGIALPYAAILVALTIPRWIIGRRDRRSSTGADGVRWDVSRRGQRLR